MTALTISLDRRLQAFGIEMFERSGGVADWSTPDACGSVVVPAELAAAVPLPGEEFSLSTVPAPGTLHVSVASDFLDIAARTLDFAVPRHGSFCIRQRYLTTRDLTDKIAHTFAWQNARAKCRDAQPAQVTYHLWTLHGSLRAEDVWEEVLQFAVNEESGAPLDLPEVFHEPDLAGEEVASAADSPSTYVAAIAEGKRRLIADSTHFVRRVEQRLERDRRRLQEYYHALAREATSPRRRAVAVPSPEETEAKQRAVDLELRRKLAELNENHALQAEIRPVALARVRLPALVVPVTIQRKQSTREYKLYWNSLLKVFEPLACSRCGGATFQATFVNETVAVLCARCADEA